ncbi:MAG: DUF2892 domain-containing protein [Spiribacter sp.]|jgi:hypothetical protein|nr:DUF2892 domain-containing protein [Spiribacter sp.]MDR9479937.1 DUF2892 domain-containing protein [Spiribacter sp.]
MSVNEGLRAMAGFFVLLSLALGTWLHPGWYLFTAFVGINLLQSAFTRWCPAMAVLRRLGLRDDDQRHAA